MIPHLFISYAKQDSKLAERLCQYMESKGLQCWIAPRDIRPGEIYAEAIINAINTGGGLLLILTSASNESPHVLREVERAISKRLTVVTLRIDGTQPGTAMEYFLSSTHWLDSKSSELEQHLCGLHQILNQLICEQKSSLESPTSQITTTAANGSLRPLLSPQLKTRRLAIATILILLLAISIAVIYKLEKPQQMMVPSSDSEDSMLVVTNQVPTDNFELIGDRRSQHKTKAERSSNIDSGARSDTDRDTKGGTANTNGATTSLSSSSPRTDHSKDVTMAVLYFDNTGEDKSLVALRKGLTDMLISDLAAISGIRVVERARLEEIIKELKLNSSQVCDQSTAQRVGHLLGAQVLLMGSFFELLGQFRIDARLIRTETGEVVTAQGISGKKQDFMLMQKQLLWKIVDGLQVERSPTQEKAIMASASASYEAVVKYSQGLELLDGGKHDEALIAFQQAFHADSTFDRARVMLATLAQD